MNDYYRLLNLKRSASVDEIKAAVRTRLRLEMGRLNDSRLEVRQEAEKVAEQIREAQVILLDETKRAEYDRQLSSPQREVARTDRSVLTRTDNLVEEGWQLLANGNVADALTVAKEAVNRNKRNPYAWDLLAQAKFRWGEIDEAIADFRKAIQLKPNEAELYFDLGNVYESLERWNDALMEFRHAIEIDPGATRYRTAVGMLLVKNKNYEDGIKILEACHQEDPQNEFCKEILAFAYVERGYEDWTFIPPGSRVPTGYYATEKSHVDRAMGFVDKAEKLGLKGDEAAQDIATAKQNVMSMGNRRFWGSWLTTIVALGMGLILIAAGGWPYGVYFLVCGILYVISARAPQFMVNRQLIAGHTKWGVRGFLADGFEGGFVSGAIIMALTSLGLLIVLPVIVLYNFVKNYS